MKIRNQQRALTLIELLVVVVLVVVIALVTLQFITSRPHPLAKRAVCASNIRGIGQGLHIYANGNSGYFPHSRPESTQNSPGEFAVVQTDYAGTLGSTSRLSIRDSNEISDKRGIGHSSRVMFLLVTAGTQITAQFVCPTTDDEEDDLDNHGQDQTAGDHGQAATPGINRFDFRGYDKLSFGMHLPIGRRISSEGDVRLPLMADKGPYFEAGDEFADTRSRPDRRSKTAPPAALANTRNGLLALDREKWRPWNSRNHKGEGQNVLYLDGHAEFVRTPLAGIDHDNIYTAATRSDPTGGLIGKVAEPGTETARIAPLTETDCYIVP